MTGNREKERETERIKMWTIILFGTYKIEMTEDNNGMGEVALCFSSPSKADMKKKERKQAVVFVFLFHIYIYISLLIV